MLNKRGNGTSGGGKLQRAVFAGFGRLGDSYNGAKSAGTVPARL
jgi:hypothetical protein